MVFINTELRTFNHTGTFISFFFTSEIMEEPDWPTPRRGLTRSVDDAEDFTSAPGTVFRDHSLNTPLVEDDHQVHEQLNKSSLTFSVKLSNLK